MLTERVASDRPHWRNTMCAEPVIIITSEDQSDEDFHEHTPYSEADEHREHDYRERYLASRMNQ
jgi:hypothetical protein